MHIPCITAYPLSDGFEAYAAIRVASLLNSDLLKEHHYGIAETKESSSFSKLNPRHLQDGREMLLSALASLTEATFEIRICVLPDLLHKAQGEIDIHLVIRCAGATDAEAKERVASSYLALMPVLVSVIPEADFKLVKNRDELERCREPFETRHAAAIVRRRQDVRLASLTCSAEIGFLPGHVTDSATACDITSHILPWIPSHDDWGRLLDVLTGQLEPSMLLIRVRPYADVSVEQTRVARTIEQCEAVLVGLESSDMVLRKQVTMLVEQSVARQETLRHPCFHLSALVVSRRPISPALSSSVGTAISGRRLGGEEPALLQGGFDVKPVADKWFMGRTFFVDDAPFTIGEAACAFRLPSPPNRDIPGLAVQRFRTSLAMLPSELDESPGAIRLFVNEYQGMSQPVCIAPDDRMRHAFIMGQTGTGKSTLMESMIVQDIRAGRGLAVIDPHGDMIDNILKRIPKERAEDVIVFDFLDRGRPLAFNILHWRDIGERDLIIDELYRTLDHIYDMKLTGGPMFEQHFRNFLKLLMGDSVRPEFTPTILEFIRCYTDSSFRRWLLKSIEDQQVRDFVAEAEDVGGECALKNISPYVSSKFGRFVNDTTLKRIVGQEKSSIDFDAIMNKGKILLVKLGKGRFGSEVSALLANMLVTRFKFAAMKRGEMPKEDRRDFFLYVDEAHNLPQGENLSDLLAEARKYRLGLILATQYCSQLGSVSGGRGDDLLAAIFGNVGSLMTFRTGTQDAEHLSRGFTPYFSQSDIIALPNFCGYARMNLNNQAMPPFSFRTELDSSLEDEKLGERIRSLSRLKYGNDANLVDAEIYRRMNCWKEEEREEKPAEKVPPPSVVNLVILDLELSALEPSPRLSAAVQAAGMQTIGAILRCHENELVTNRGIAGQNLRELKRLLKDHGCCLKEPEEDQMPFDFEEVNTDDDKQ